MSQRQITDFKLSEPPRKKQKICREKAPSSIMSKINNLDQGQKQTLYTLSTTDRDLFNKCALKFKFTEQETDELLKSISSMFNKSNSSNTKKLNIDRLILTDAAPKMLSPSLSKLWGKDRRKGM